MTTKKYEIQFLLYKEIDTNVCECLHFQKKKNYKRGQWLPYEHENIENDLNEWKKTAIICKNIQLTLKTN